MAHPGGGGGKKKPKYPIRFEPRKSECELFRRGETLGKWKDEEREEVCDGNVNVVGRNVEGVLLQREEEGGREKYTKEGEGNEGGV